MVTIYNITHSITTESPPESYTDLSSNNIILLIFGIILFFILAMITFRLSKAIIKHRESIRREIRIYLFHIQSFFHPLTSYCMNRYEDILYFLQNGYRFAHLQREEIDRENYSNYQLSVHYSSGQRHEYLHDEEDDGIDHDLDPHSLHSNSSHSNNSSSHGYTPTMTTTTTTTTTNPLASSASSSNYHHISIHHPSTSYISDEDTDDDDPSGLFLKKKQTQPSSEFEMRQILSPNSFSKQYNNHHY